MSADDSLEVARREVTASAGEDRRRGDQEEENSAVQGRCLVSPGDTLITPVSVWWLVTPRPAPEQS